MNTQDGKPQIIGEEKKEYILSDEEKMHFKAEETFRYEVRKSLEKKEKKTFWRKVWELINSAFGLWLLSTVIVGLVASSYSDIRAKNEAATKNIETMRKLSTEISSRLQMFKVSLMQLSPDRYYNYSYVQLAHMIDGTGIIDKGSVSQDRPIFVFPEFQDRTMQSLLFEMERLTKDEKQAATIKEGRTIIGRIKNSLMTMEDPPRPSSDVSIIEQRMQMRAQTASVSKPSAQDSLEAAGYLKIMAVYNQQVEAYHKRIKIILDRLGKELLKNSFLKEESAD